MKRNSGNSDGARNPERQIYSFEPLETGAILRAELKMAKKRKLKGALRMLIERAILEVYGPKQRKLLSAVNVAALIPDVNECKKFLSTVGR